MMLFFPVAAVDMRLGTYATYTTYGSPIILLEVISNSVKRDALAVMPRCEEVRAGEHVRDNQNNTAHMADSFHSCGSVR